MWSQGDRCIAELCTRGKGGHSLMENEGQSLVETAVHTGIWNIDCGTA